MKSKECKVVYVDDIKTKYKVNATVFNLEEIKKQEFNRAKKKAETRKMAEEYLDR